MDAPASDDEANENTLLLPKVQPEVLPDRKGGSPPSSTNSDGDSEVKSKTSKVDSDIESYPGHSAAASPVSVDLNLIEPPPLPPAPVPRAVRIEPAPPERNIVECSCCLQCTKNIQRHKIVNWTAFIVLMIFSSLLVLTMVALGLYMVMNFIGHEKSTTLKIPPATVVKYPLADTDISKLFFHKGLTVEITYIDAEYTSSLVQVALSHKHLSLTKVNFDETFANQASVARYWTENVSGTITCNEKMRILSKKISMSTSTAASHMAASSQKMDFLSHNDGLECSTPGGVECSSTGVTPSTILQNATGNGELIEMKMCDGTNNGAATFRILEPLPDLSGIPNYDLVQHKNENVSINFGNTITNPSRIGRNPCLYISTLYLKCETKCSQFPVHITIHFTETYGYYIGLFIPIVLLAILSALIIYCYCKHQSKKSCSLACLYYDGGD